MRETQLTREIRIKKHKGQLSVLSSEFIFVLLVVFVVFGVLAVLY